MKEKNKPENAWQPLTPRGVAAFALAPFWRLLLSQMVIAALAGAAAGWLLGTHWTPVLSAAIQQMPEAAVIRNGALSGVQPARLAENGFLSAAIHSDDSTRGGSAADVQLLLGARDFRLCSLLGCVEMPYPRGFVIALGRPVLAPWWEAREPILIALAGAAFAVALMVAWALLAALYMPLARVAGYYADRDLSWFGSWKLCGAALMPGALLFTAAILMYGLQWFDPVRLTFALAAHFAVGWIYLPFSIYSVRPIPQKASQKANPFRKKT